MEQQFEQNECGLSIIEYIVKKTYNKRIDLTELKTEANLNKNGASITEMKRILFREGINLNAFKVPFNELKKNKDEEFVALIKNKDNNHYVIIKVYTDYVKVNDPSMGKYILTFDEFRNIFLEVVMTFEKREDFILEKKTSKNTNLFFEVLKDWQIILYIFISIILSIIFTISSSFFMKIVFDKILPNMLSKLLNLTVMAFVTLAVIKSVNAFIRSYLMKKLFNRSEILIFRFYSKSIFKSELKVVEKYNNSDILRRMMLIEQVSHFIVSSLFILFQESIGFVVASSILMWINIKLYAIATMIILASSLISMVFYVFVNSLYKVLINKSLYSLSFNNMMTRFKAFNKNSDLNNYAQREINNRFLSVKSSEYKMWKVISLKSLIMQSIGSVMPIIITYLSLTLIFKNSMSTGSMMLFLSIFSFYTMPFNNLIDYVLKYRQNKINYELVKEFIDIEEEKLNVNGMYLQSIKKMEIKNLSFSYEKEILNIKNLVIPRVLNIKGPNGSGKSTLAKIVSLRYKARSSLLINDIDSSFYNIKRFREMTFYISPEFPINSGTIIDIASFGSDELKKNIKHNVEKYGLGKILSDNNLSLDKEVSDGGENISSGQKQLIIMLSLLSRKYALIVLDEAFENISLSNMRVFRKAITDFQKDARWLQISHSKRYIVPAKEVNIEEFNSCQN